MNINFGLHSQRRKGDFKLMHYQPHIRCNIAYTPWPSAYCPPLTSFYLSNITSFVRPVIPLSANTDTGHLVLFRIVGQSFQPLGGQTILSQPVMCPNLLIIFAREPQWAIWRSNQDLHLICKGHAYSFTGTMLTPYKRHYRSSHAVSSYSTHA